VQVICWIFFPVCNNQPVRVICCAGKQPEITVYLDYSKDVFCIFIIVVLIMGDLIACMPDWEFEVSAFAFYSWNMTWEISSDLEGYYFILLCYILDLNKGMLVILVNYNILWAISCKCFLFFQQIQSVTPCHECQKPSRDPPTALLGSTIGTSYISFLQKMDSKFY